ncbi:MAG: NAD(P)-dependent oxidoreductase [Anaerolineae bacterium]|nr:NAD(P)-dependent oxidoreductase [Anaerolineae bacterium]
MRIAIVGATGVLGRALVPLLARHSIRALVRTPDTARRLFGEHVEAVACDLLAPGIGARLPDLLAGCDVVIHAATAIPSDFSQPGAMDTTNRLRSEGVAHLLAATLQVGASAYIQQSIAFAHIDYGDAWITEDTPLDPKRTVVIEMEHQVRAVPTDRLRWCILRGGTFVGKDTFQDGTIERLRAGQEKIACDGRAFMPLVHVEDVASAFAAAVERAPAGSTFNIVDEPIRQGDYLERLARAVGAPEPPRDPDAPCLPSHRVSNQAARETLGWTPRRGVIP